MKETYLKTITGFCLYALCLILSGCAVDSTEVDSGKFVDAPVEGLMYESGSIVGRTDSEGKFYYEGTQSLTLSIEGLIIGEVAPKDYIFPFDLFTSNLFVQDTRVSNMSRFLQSLDEDGNPDNGIFISPTRRSQVAATFGTATSIDFSGSAFEGISSFTTLRSAAAAETHLLASLASHGQLKVDLINLGDGFTAGVQSAQVPFQNNSTSSINLHKFTQPEGYPAVMAGKLSALFGSNFTWSNPLLGIDESRNKTLASNTVHYNLAVPGATTDSLLNETTQTFANYSAEFTHTMLNELLVPIFKNLSDSCATTGTQIDAALCLANQPDHEQRLKVFTLWIGMNDVLGAVTAGKGSKLTATDIGNFLTLHDASTVMGNISTAVSQLSSVKNSYLFIATIPDITRVGALFYKEDFDYMARFPNPDVTALKNFTSASTLDTDVVAVGFSILSTIGVNLNVSSNNTVLDTVIGNLPDKLTLTKGEAALLTARVDQLNSYINTFAAPAAYPHVFVVDLHHLYEELAAGNIEATTGNILDRGFGGGFFSMDGIYPSHTGYALIAKEFLERLRSPYTINNTADGAYATYTSFVLSEGIKTDDGIGIKVDPENIDMSGIWENDPYRDNDGDGFPDGPGQIVFISGTTISSMDPSLGLMKDCNDSDINTSPQVISQVSCN